MRSRSIGIFSAGIACLFVLSGCSQATSTAKPTPAEVSAFKGNGPAPAPGQMAASMNAVHAYYLAHHPDQLKNGNNSMPVGMPGSVSPAPGPPTAPAQ